MIIIEIILIVCILSFILIPILDVLGFKLNDFLIDDIDNNYYVYNIDNIDDENDNLLENNTSLDYYNFNKIYTKIEEVIGENLIVYDYKDNFVYLYDFKDSQLLYTLNVLDYQYEDSSWYITLQRIYHDKYGINIYIDSLKNKPKFEIDNKLVEIRCAITNDLLNKKQIKKSKWCKSCKIVLSEDSLIYNNGRCIQCNSEDNIKKKIPKKLLK